MTWRKNKIVGRPPQRTIDRRDQTIRAKKLKVSLSHPCPRCGKFFCTCGEVREARR